MIFPQDSKEGRPVLGAVVVEHFFAFIDQKVADLSISQLPVPAVFVLGVCPCLVMVDDILEQVPDLPIPEQQHGSRKEQAVSAICLPEIMDTRNGDGLPTALDGTEEDWV